MLMQSLQIKQSPSGLLIISVSSRAGRPQKEQIVSISLITLLETIIVIIKLYVSIAFL